jgi:branched-chain amino acid transport system substrate-binding protein
MRSFEAAPGISRYMIDRSPKVNAMRKNTIAILVLVLGVVLFTTCKQTTTPPTPTPSPSAGNIRLGVINSTTGLFADQGQLVNNGILLARDEINAKGGINGRQIELLIEDDGSDSANAVKAYQKLVDAKVEAIIGPLSSGATAAIAPLADKSQIVEVVPTAHAQNLASISKNVFLIYPSTDAEAQFVANSATRQLKARRVALLEPNNQFTDSYVQAVRKHLTEAGATIVADERYDESTTDFQEQVKKISSSTPDVLITPSFLPVAPTAIIKSAAAINPRLKVMLRGAACTVALNSMDELVLPAAFRTNNIFIVNESFGNVQSGNAAFRSFATTFQSRFNAAPAPYSVAGYSAVNVVKNAIEKGGSGGEQMKRALTGGEFETAIGTVRFDQRQVNTAATFSLFKLGDKGAAPAGQLVLVQ